MNIGILTFHWATNHGAILQAFALQKYLKENIEDAEVYIIDYYPARYQKTLKNALRSRNPFVILQNLKDCKKEKILAPFRENLKRTHRYYSLEQLTQFPPDCDVLISGSDQVWNEFFTLQGEGKTTLSYYLPFQPNARKISYAASFGLISLSPEMAYIIKPYLEKFDAISTREASGNNIIKKLGLSATTVCDPTALLDADKYPAENINKKQTYAVKYFLRKPDKTNRQLIGKIFKRIKQNGIKKIFDIEYCSIEQWLGYIRKASFLVTNSFHGMIFALKYHIPFAVILENRSILSGMNDRFFSLLKELQLEDRIITSDTDIDSLFDAEIPWDRTEELFEKLVESSKQFLKTNCKPLNSQKSITLYKPSECCGCGSCVQVCPKNCISFIEDKEGFSYPTVDVEKCIKCGKCCLVCPIKHPAKETFDIKDIYISYSKDQECRKNSSSGGIFSELARLIFLKSGIVYGAAFDSDFHLSHKKAENEEELKAIRGSKYIQSDTTFAFLQIKQNLDSGRNVLFCGTPCQVEGLKNYLAKDYENLYIVDIICHGVASPRIWNSYISSGKNSNAKIKSVNFRDKTYGWTNYSIKIEYEQGYSQTSVMSKDTFLQLFLRDIILRPACYSCKFKGTKRVSDITIGDAWGIKHFYEKWQDDKGVTLAMVHTDKGKQLFEQLKGSAEIVVLNDCKALNYNSAMIKSPVVPKCRDAFFRDYNSSKYTLEKLLKKHSNEPLIISLKKKVKAAVKKLGVKNG